MKKTRLLICLVLAVVMLFGAVQVFATEEETTTATPGADVTVDETAEETAKDDAEVATPELSTDAKCIGDAKHSFATGNKYELNSEAHWRYCETCKKYIGEKHDLQEGYKTSETQHWHYCLKCKQKVSVQDHTFGEVDENYQKTCSICAKKVDEPHEHGYAEEWSSNAYGHWHRCVNTYGLRGESFCKDQSGMQDHEFDANGVCTVCGKENVIPAERPGDAGPLWIVFIVIGVVGAGSAAAVFLVKKKK